MALLDIEREAFSTFGHIPGVGKSISVDLWDLGLRSVQDLGGAIQKKCLRRPADWQGGQWIGASCTCIVVQLRMHAIQI
jgi:hypothetical protein